MARRLRRWLRRPDDDGLRRVLGSWVREVAESFAPRGEAPGAELTLEELEMTVAERAREWSRQLIREGREHLGILGKVAQQAIADPPPGYGPELFLDRFECAGDIALAVPFQQDGKNRRKPPDRA